MQKLQLVVEDLQIESFTTSTAHQTVPANVPLTDRCTYTCP